MSKKKTKRAEKKRKEQLAKRLLLAGVLAALLFVAAIGYMIRSSGLDDEEDIYAAKGSDDEPNIDVQLLTINEYSRPGISLDQVQGIVIHYTANPGSTAQENHDYFENLKDTHATKVSSHFVIGLNGEIIQCIPSSEISYASNDRNHDTLSIECCHPDETGEFNEETYNSLVSLSAFLCDKFQLSTDQIIRHYDITGKDCPKYYVEHEDSWKLLLTDIDAAIEK